MRTLFLDELYMIHMHRMNPWDTADRISHPDIRPRRKFLVLAFLLCNVFSNLMDIHIQDKANYFHHMQYSRYKYFQILWRISHKHNPQNYTQPIPHYHLASPT